MPVASAHTPFHSPTPHPTSHPSTFKTTATLQDISHSKYVLTSEAEAYLTAGSPEAQLFAAVPAEGVSLATVKATLSPEVADVGFKQAMQQRWVALDKSGGEPRIVRKVRGCPVI
jgi:hypothetical protein